MRVMTGWLALSLIFTWSAVQAQDPPQDPPAGVGAKQPPAAGDSAQNDPPGEDAAQAAPTKDSGTKNPAAIEPTPPAGDPEAPAVKEFYQKFDEFKAIVQRLRDIQREYKVVRPTGREALEKEFHDKMLESDERFRALMASAPAAFAANPADKEIGDFLGATAMVLAERDGKFEEAIAKLEVLAEYNFRLEELADPYGRIAFEVSDYETAEKYLKKAEELKSLTPTGKERLARIEEEKKHWGDELAARERDAALDAEPLPQIRLKTTQGDVLIELFENDAPNTVANFITLVEQGYYDDLPFTLVQPGYRADVGTVLPGSPKELDYTIPSEGHGESFRRHFRGSVSLNWPQDKGKDGGNAEISILLVPDRSRDPAKSETGQDTGNTVFGRVVEGLDVLSEFAANNIAQSQQQLDKVIDAEVVRKREHPYEVKKVEPGKPDGGTADDNSKPGEGDSPKMPAAGEEDAGSERPATGAQPAGESKSPAGESPVPDNSTQDPKGGDPDNSGADAPEQP